MAFTEKNLARQAVAAAVETLYTVPASTTAIIKDIHICNNGSTDCYVSIWLVPLGDSESRENIIFNEWNVPGNDFVHWNGYQILNTVGDTIVASSEIVNQITVTVSGAELI